MAAPQKRNKTVDRRGDKKEKSQRIGVFRVASWAITANSGLHIGPLAYASGRWMVGSSKGHALNGHALLDANAPTQPLTMRITSPASSVDARAWMSPKCCCCRVLPLLNRPW
jgi:hypothetical protein